MKAVVSPLGILDAGLATPENEADDQSSARGEAFDAVLALVASQSAVVTAPVKGLALSVGPSLNLAAPSAASAEGKQDPGLGLSAQPKVAPAHASGLTVRHVDVTPTQAFEPWPGMNAAAAGSEAALQADGQGVRDVPASASAAPTPTGAQADLRMPTSTVKQTQPLAAGAVEVPPPQTQATSPAAARPPAPNAKTDARSEPSAKRSDQLPLEAEKPQLLGQTVRPTRSDDVEAGPARKSDKTTDPRELDRDGETATPTPKSELASPPPMQPLASPLATPQSAPLQISGRPRPIASVGPEARAVRGPVADTTPAPSGVLFEASLASERTSPPPAPLATTASDAPLAGTATPVTASSFARRPELQPSAPSSALAQASQAPVTREPTPQLVDAQAEQAVARAPAVAATKVLGAVRADVPAGRPLVTSDAQTGAVVTRIEVYETTQSAEAELGQTSDAKLESSQGRDESLPTGDSGQATSEQSTQQERSGDRSQAERAEPRLAPQAPFQATETQGMRGLDAVVASLLRTGAASTDSAPRATTVSRQLGLADVKVATGKSASTKIDEKLATVTRALTDAELQREEERVQARELLELGTAHAHVAEPQWDTPSAAEPTQVAAPVVVPAHVPDPDAAMMGKLARGESLNAAISIEHPELGSMDVEVQSENGRVDVRAVMDTPRAAAVLRAHESALRYGIQQAGMTFGALRVRARTGEAQTVKARDTVKRRRGNEWEA